MEGPETNPDEVQNGGEESRQHIENKLAAEDSDKNVVPSESCEINNEETVENSTDQLGEKVDQKFPPKKVGGADKKVSFVLPSETDVNTESNDEVSLREKKPKTYKKGHRRESEGVVTYKKIVTSELMGSIQLGLHYVIGKINSNSISIGSLKRKRDVLLKDFAVVETVTFPKGGSTITPAHNYKEFQFQSYAPIAFDNFRRIYDICPQLYLSSLCSCPMIELSNSGASGSIFYKTKDDNFICKTVFKKEAVYLQKILAGYWINFKQNPETYLPKFFGLYCYTCNTKNIRIVVMNNLMPSEIKIHHVFDLKGSTFKRTASKKERKKKSPTYKDLDFIEMYPNGIILDYDVREKLMDTLERDCLVLESFKIMDYSLLLSVHNLSIPTDDNDKQEKNDENLSSNTSSPLPEPPAGLYVNIPEENIRQSQMLSSGRIPITGQNEKGEKLLLFIGIIDILQSYDLSKQFEHLAKSMVQDGKQISVNHPEYYKSRFLEFMREKVFPLKRDHATRKSNDGNGKRKISITNSSSTTTTTS